MARLVVHRRAARYLQRMRVINLHDRVAGTVVVAHVGPRGDVFK